MLDQFDSLGLYSLAEHNYLRMEAMDLFERCVTEGCPDYLMAFIEEQITHEPPRIELLQDMAEDLRQRLAGLREDHFDVRNRLLQTLRADFQIDLGAITSLGTLDNDPRLNVDHLIDYAYRQNPRLTSQDQNDLRKMLRASFDMTAQLHKDVEMTDELLVYILDWADGLTAFAMRYIWLYDWETFPNHFLQ